MAESSEILETLKAMQLQMGDQAIAHQRSLQQYMATVDTKIDELRSQLHSFPPSSGTRVQPQQSLRGSDLGAVSRSMKMDIPKFEGSDPSSWVFRIEEFFNFHDTPDELRLRIVSFHLEGRASAWFQWMKMNNLLTTWPSFLSSLKQRFGASMYEDHQGALSKLTQTTTVTEFQTAFEDLMNKVSGIPESLLISFFITGLRNDIRRELLMSRPSSLMEAFALARAYESHIEETALDHRSWHKGPS
ncbi:hypothetical protein J5N97_027087 [Dioscorea zingiberensis]|uniref:Ty3 transposon capsid-like protein domain-containing protein n=1 Tax=Dioscorea zingiberensis TaxID=325984 RepID=A0A9D5C488_9LILI|nr:hypothetical protein J5N97_027087 [Dioscorea zingiberensis]